MRALLPQHWVRWTSEGLLCLLYQMNGSALRLQRVQMLAFISILTPTAPQQP